MSTLDNAKVTTYVSNDTHERLKKIARKEKRSVSSLIHKLIVDYLDTVDPNHDPNAGNT